MRDHNCPAISRIASTDVWQSLFESCSVLIERASESGVFSNKVRLRICRISLSGRSTRSSRHEERRTSRQHVEPREVDVTTVHDVERARLDRQVIEHRDVVRFPVSDPYKTGDIASQVQQCVQLHRSFATTEPCPRKQTQAQIDRGRVQSINRLLQRYGQRDRRSSEDSRVPSSNRARLSFNVIHSQTTFSNVRPNR